LQLVIYKFLYLLNTWLQGYSTYEVMYTQFNDLMY